MKFLYKIWSGYDGFQPRAIPHRLNGRDLDLGWRRYIEAVGSGDEVLVYFYGPHKYAPGVYINGFVKEVDLDQLRVRIRVREYSVDRPITDAETSARVGEVVSVRNRQVFLFPQHWDTTPSCTLFGVADSCKERACSTCPTWQSLRLVKPSAVGMPPRLRSCAMSTYTPAFWVIPRRCYLYREGSIKEAVRQTSSVFYRFKVGEEALAYPLARAIYASLTRRRNVDFDAVVPIPLSPDKDERAEIHRTRLLARELARLLGTKCAEVLSLSDSISKHKLRVTHGLSAVEFEGRYSQALVVDKKVGDFRQALLVDDVCTEGSTFRSAIYRLREANPKLDVAVAAAGQMIIKSVVRNVGGLLES